MSVLLGGNGSAFAYGSVLPSLAAEAATLEELGAAVSAELGRRVPHDGYHLMALDPFSGACSFHVTRHGYGAESLRGLEREFGRPEEAFPFASLFQGPTPVGVLSNGVHEHRYCARLHDIMRAEGMCSEMRLALSLGGRAWGGVVLLREKGSRPFSLAEIDQAEKLAGPLAAALRAFVASKPLRIASHGGPPGVIIVDGHDAIRAVTPGAREWLRAYVPDPAQPVDDDALFTALCNITHTARRSPDGSAVSQLFTPCGWATAHAQPLGVDGEQGNVITIQPATADALLPAVAEWYGITLRERDVIRHALHGVPVKHIARTLGVSVHTANDHLKSVYRKLGVAGRDELFAACLVRTGGS
ncbi:helix-turn-helix transcriptional regulator [Streptomyces lasiicapitis]|uniref:helix-turn-helix transcriptional regulator n=1 Tax=Streptomyces lasiicapitis TaxID=1923961 RepID=UPI0036BDD811